MQTNAPDDIQEVLSKAGARAMRAMNACNGPTLTEKQLKAKRVSEDEEDQDARKAKRRFYKSKYYRLAIFGNGQPWIKYRLWLPSMIEQGADVTELVIAAKDILQRQGKPITDNAVCAIVKKGFNDFHNEDLDDLAHGLAPSQGTQKIAARTACDWWMAGLNAEPEPIQAPDDFPALSDLMASRFTQTPAPPFPWLLRNAVPLGMTTALAAAAGSGKSFWLLQTAMAIVSGCPLVPGFDIAPEGKGKALLVFCEEEDKVVHERVQNLIEALIIEREDAADIVQAINSRLVILNRFGKDNRIVTMGRDGQPTPTRFYDSIVKLVEEIGEDLKMVALDPWSCLAPQAEKDPAESTAAITMLNALAEKTGAAIIIASHTRKPPKSGGRRPSSLELLSADEIRGSSALVGAVRAAIMLTPLAEHEHKLMLTSNAHDTILCGVVKSNHGKRPDAVLLRRGDGGSLLLGRSLGDEEVSEAVEESLARDQVKIILERETQSERRHTPREFARIFKNRITFRGAPITEAKLSEILARAVVDGVLVRVRREGDRADKLELPPNAIVPHEPEWSPWDESCFEPGPPPEEVYYTS